MRLEVKWHRRVSEDRILCGWDNAKDPHARETAALPATPLVRLDPSFHVQFKEA